MFTALSKEILLISLLEMRTKERDEIITNHEMRPDGQIFFLGESPVNQIQVNI